MPRRLLILPLLATLLAVSWLHPPKPQPISYQAPTPTVIPTITPTPTPKPLTMAQLNAAYGPCVYLPVIFYHHITDSTKFPGLSVNLKYFTDQMQYLSTHSYSSISPDDLSNFFDSGRALPPKPILITFDDAYDDFISAVPILRQFGLQATLFVPTGLLNNPGYLSWDQISSVRGQGIYLANHTWSHHQLASAKLSVIQSEIDTAAHQLTDHENIHPTVFAYPYGTPGTQAENYLKQQGYLLAFTTTPGHIQCKGQRLALPRTRMGNALPSAYGL